VKTPPASRPVALSVDALRETSAGSAASSHGAHAMTHLAQDACDLCHRRHPLSAAVVSRLFIVYPALGLLSNAEDNHSAQHRNAL